MRKIEAVSRMVATLLRSPPNSGQGSAVESIWRSEPEMDQPKPVAGEYLLIAGSVNPRPRHERP
jgi:hypothetical protein